MALEARRLDMLEQVVSSSTDVSQTLKYALQVCQGLVINREFRQQVGGQRQPSFAFPVSILESLSPAGPK